MEQLLSVIIPEPLLENPLTDATSSDMEKDGGSPAKSVLEELEELRAILHESVARYQLRLEGEIDAVVEVVQANKEDTSSGKIRDARDMLTILRNMDLKVEKGRRKDLRKIESVLGDIALLTEKW